LRSVSRLTANDCLLELSTHESLAGSHNALAARRCRRHAHRHGRALLCERYEERRCQRHDERWRVRDACGGSGGRARWLVTLVPDQVTPVQCLCDDNGGARIELYARSAS
jgi:hypothetical protein